MSDSTMNHDYLLKEYDAIRTEINDKIKLQNTLITFTITTCVALIAASMSNQNPYMLLTTYFVLIPMSLRIRYYRLAMMKLSAYQAAFIEPQFKELNWETRNRIFLEKHATKQIKSRNFSPFLKYTECLILAICTYLIYFIEICASYEMSLKTVLLLICPLVFVVVELYITIRTNQIENSRKELETQWLNAIDPNE